MPSAVRHAVEAAQEKQAKDLLVIDITGLTAFTDYFVICHGDTVRQVKAISDAVRERLKKEGARIDHTEGLASNEWVLIDVGDLIVHVFHREKREFYGLENLWHDGRRVSL